MGAQENINGAEAEAPSVVPLNAVFATDFVAILVAVNSTNTVDELAAAVAHHSEGRRVRAQPYPKIVFHKGKKVPGHLTVAQAGIKPLDHVSVEYDVPPGAAS